VSIGHKNIISVIFVLVGITAILYKASFKPELENKDVSPTLHYREVEMDVILPESNFSTQSKYLVIFSLTPSLCTISMLNNVSEYVTINEENGFDFDMLLVWVGNKDNAERLNKIANTQARAHMVEMSHEGRKFLEWDNRQAPQVVLMSMEDQAIVYRDPLRVNLSSKDHKVTVLSKIKELSKSESQQSQKKVRHYD